MSHARPILLLIFAALALASAVVYGQIEEEELFEPGAVVEPTSQPAPPANEPEAGSDPVDPELMVLERQAERSFIDDDLETAIALYRQLANRHQRQDEKIRILMTIAYLEHDMGRRLAAERTLTEVLTLDPDYEYRPELYAADFTPLFYEAQRAAIELIRSGSDDDVRTGSEHLRARRYDAARQSFQAALAARADHPQALYNLALVDLYQDRDEQALAGFEKLLALAASRDDLIEPHLEAQALTNVGLIYIQNQQLEAAESVLAKAVELSPDSREAWLNLGLSRRGLGRGDTAAVAFRRAYDLAPDDIQTIDSLALAYLDSGDWPAAVTLLQQATQRFANDAGLWLKLGLAHLRRGSEGDAETALLTAQRLDADNADGWASTAALELAGMYYARQDHRSALSQSQRAIGWRPDLVNAWIFQGLAQLAGGQLDDAVSSLEQARKLDPTRVDVLVNLGSTYYRQGQLEQAEQAFERALSLQPDHADAARNLQAVREAKRLGLSGGGTRTAPGPSRGNSSSSSSQRSAPAAPAPVRRADLGMRFSNADYSALGLRGVLVEAIYTDSAASRAGLHADDLLLRIDNREISSDAQLRSLLAGLPTGKVLRIDLLRDNRPATVTLKVP